MTGRTRRVKPRDHPVTCAVTSRIAMPPGSYVVAVDGRKIPFEASEGGELEITPE